MPENDLLLKAVLDQPDDDAPRLRYAAWCERQTDDPTKARAEFIRAQIALARGPDLQQANQLNFTADELEKVHRSNWGRPVSTLVDSYRFDRGFIEWVGLPAAKFLQATPRLFALAPIRHLMLTEVQPVVRQLCDSGHLQTIRSLELDRCDLNDEDVGVLAGCRDLKELRWLSFTGNHLSDEAVRFLANSPHLKKLAYANLAGSIIDPNERYSYDNGQVMESWMPPDGIRFEKRFGHLPWLHHPAKSIMDSIPDRFRIAARAEVLAPL